METVFVLETAAAFDWKLEGVFDNQESIDKYIKEEYDVSFEEYLEHHPNSTREDWYEEIECRVRKTKKK